jgi:hypothetical protein
MHYTNYYTAMPVSSPLSHIHLITHNIPHANTIRAAFLPVFTCMGHPQASPAAPRTR